MADNPAYSHGAAEKQRYTASTASRTHPQVNVYPPPAYQQSATSYPTQPQPTCSTNQPIPYSSAGPPHCCVHATQPRDCEQHTTVHPNDWKARIPIMPMWLAVTCLIINCILPGFGTVMSSFSVCCCASPAVLAGHGKCRTYCSTFWIGWLQMICIPFFLLGYVWAIAWGVAAVEISRKYYGKDLSSIIVNEHCECVNR